MKNINLLVSLTLCLLATTSCQQDEPLPYNGNTVSANATMEEVHSRSSMTDLGFFSWEQGDEIGVWATNLIDGKSSFQCLPFVKQAGAINKAIFEAVLDGAFTFSQYAVYPYSTDHSISETTLTVTLPDTYNYTGKVYTPNTNALMVANIGEKTATLGDLDFYHAGGVVSVKLIGLPAGTCGIRLTTDKDITGTFTVNNPDSTAPTISAGSKTSKNAITIKFDALEKSPSEIMQFFFPVPVGEYTFTLEYLKASATEGAYEAFEIKEGRSTNIVERSQLILMPTLTLLSTEATAERMGFAVSTIGNETTYIVYTAEGLQAVNKLVNDDLDANIFLAENIDLTDAPKDESGSNWVAIGTENAPYMGTFDGNGKDIEGLIINEAATKGQGLVGSLDSEGQVKGVRLIGCQITGTKEDMGAIVGNNKGKVSGCYVIGTPTYGAKIVSSFENNTGLSSHATCVGGIVGVNNSATGIITGCHVSGNIFISTPGISVGGIAGFNLGGSIEQCSVKTSSATDNITISSTETVRTSSFVGGIAGSNEKGGSINNCSVSASNGKIQITGSQGLVGGITGALGSAASLSNCSISNTDDGEITVSATRNVGGIAGQMTADTSIVGCTVSGISVVGSSDSAGGIAGVSLNGLINGCTVIGGKVEAPYYVGGGTGRNLGSNIIIACYVQGTETTMNSDQTDYANTVGSIVGANGASVISCYAYYENCTAFVGAIGVNSCNSVEGTTEACYYYAADASGNEVTLVGSDTSKEWDNKDEGAVADMNTKINQSSVAIKYQWGGTYDEPSLSTE